MKQGIQLHWSRIRHPQTQGKVERFHGTLQRAIEKRGPLPERLQEWLDAFRWEHNHVRPHEALGMETPAQRWQSSSRRYDAHSTPWEYPAGSRVLKVDCQGKVELCGRNWKISRALCGERVRVVQVEQRFQVYYCATMVREVDPETQRSTIIGRWIPGSVEHTRL
jgi:Integrase core domain